jgi:sugar phosphate permease
MVLPGFAGRVRMYVMLIGYVACFKIPRFAINTLIPFVVRDMGLPTSLTPTLLAAFHPGYICSQIPGAAVVRRSGPKYLATLQLAGCAVFMAAMPWAGNIKSRGVAVASLSALMACLGVVQGPMSPVISQLQGAWMPTGVERAIAVRFTGLAHTVSRQRQTTRSRQSLPDSAN